MGGEEPAEIGFNADIQPAPAISGLEKASAYFRGGTPLAIHGTDFEGATAVTFGGVPTAFSPVGESELVAIVPPIPYLGEVAVTVTTNAGTATAAQAFEGIACKVPKIEGRSLKAAKRILRAAHCQVGKVRLKGDATKKTGHVAGLRLRKPGQLLPPGRAIGVTLR